MNGGARNAESRTAVGPLWTAWLGVCLVAWCGGCVYPAPPGWPKEAPIATGQCNPVLVGPTQPECVWETVVDVVDDYFTVSSEEPVHCVEGLITDGELVTLPDTGATVFEPWRSDSVNLDERVQCTLQSIRRWAQVRVTPAEQGRRGYWIEVAVYKELEDMPRPAEAAVGDASFRHDGSLTRVVNPDMDTSITAGWIPLGRDAALENQILQQILARAGATPVAAR